MNLGTGIWLSYQRDIGACCRGDLFVFDPVSSLDVYNSSFVKQRWWLQIARYRQLYRCCISNGYHAFPNPRLSYRDFEPDETFSRPLAHYDLNFHDVNCFHQHLKLASLRGCTVVKATLELCLLDRQASRPFRPRLGYSPPPPLLILECSLDPTDASWTNTIPVLSPTFFEVQADQL